MDEREQLAQWFETANLGYLEGKEIAAIIRKWQPDTMIQVRAGQIKDWEAYCEWSGTNEWAKAEGLVNSYDYVEIPLSKAQNWL